LKIILVHCGGVVPALVGRWSRGLTTERPGVPVGITDPIASVRRLWVDTLAHNPDVVDLALAVFGVDRVVLGSDYPFPMGVDNPFESIGHLDAAVQDIVARNASLLQEEVAHS
jgi:aminocarboxymuconate-semialdehyde decarboxylase